MQQEQDILTPSSQEQQQTDFLTPPTAGPQDILSPPPVGSNQPQMSYSDTIGQATRLAAQSPADLPFAARHPVIQMLVVDLVKDVANTVRVGTIGMGRGGGIGGVGIGISSYLMDKADRDGPDAAEAEAMSVARGAAFIASFGGASLLEVGANLARPALAKALPAVFLGRGAVSASELLLGKAGSFLVGEFLGGSIYGSIAPVPEGQSRAEAVLGQGALFAGTGGIVRGALHIGTNALNRFVSKMSSSQRQEVTKAARAGLAQVEQSLQREGTSIVDLPPAQQEHIAQQVYKTAIQDVDPSAIDLDQIIQQEADRAVEPHPRMIGAANVVEPGPTLAEPMLPEVPFQQSLLKTPEFATPARIEPATKPAGFVEGAGTPERARRPEAWSLGEPKSNQEIPRFDLLGTERQSVITIPEHLAPSKPIPPGQEDEYFRQKFRTSTAAGIRYARVGPITGESSEIRYSLISRNVRPDEGAWRVTNFDVDRKPLVHHSFATLEEAKTYVEHTKLYEEIVLPPSTAKDIIAHQAYVQPGLDAGLDNETAVHLGARDALNDGLMPGRTTAEVVRAFDGISIRAVDAPKLLAAPERMARLATEARLANDDVVRTAHEAIEPRSVTPATPPPKGFEPTATGATAEGAPATMAETALANAATKDAIARIDPLEVAAPELRSEAVLVEQTIHDPELVTLRPKQQVSNVLNKALMSDESSTAGLLTGLTDPLPSELVLEQTLTKAERKAVRKILNTIGSEKAPIDIDPLEQIEAPYTETPGSPTPTSIPKMDELAVVGKFDDSALTALTEQFREAIRGQAGAASGRLLAVLSGGGLETLAYNDKLSPGTRTVLRTVGVILIVGGSYEVVAGWTKKYMQSFLLHANPTSLFVKAGDKEAARQLAELYTEGRALGHQHAVDIKKIVDPKNYRAVMMLVEEADPTRAAEWSQISPHEQQMVMFLNKFNFQLGVMLKNEGVIDDWVENYMRHQLPPDTFQRWKVNGFRQLPVGGSIAERRRILSLRDLEAWTQKEKLAGPVFDLPAVQSLHVEQAYRSMGNVRLVKTLEKLGTIQKMPTNALQALPEGVEQLRIAGYGDRMAPTPVARALENLSSLRPDALLSSLDTIKSWWMRSIMMWFWEHGANALRALPTMAMNPIGYAAALKAVDRNDPVLVHVAKYGLNLFDRPDYAPTVAGRFEQMINKLGPAAPTLQAVRRAGGQLIAKQDAILWDRIIPALQLFGWQNEMKKWGESTAHRFLPGSPEYTAAARRAADFANTVAGKLPLTFSNPRMLQFMRLALFSPQWTTSRLALTAHAAGELSEILAGRLDPTHTAYIPLKMRQLAWMAGVTWAGSMVMSGKEPQFNPNTHKFYMQTGLKINGHNVGLDLAGWWQDDLRAVGSPMDYLFNRLNPVFKIAYETVSGRDYLGRSMTAAQKISNILQSAGPPAEAAQLIARTVSGPPIGGGEALQRGLGVAAFGNVASLPRPLDAAIGKMAERMLRNNGIPANADNIFELSRLLRGNYISGNPFVDNRVVNYLAYRRRGGQRKDPLGTGLGNLFEYSRRVLAEF